MIYRFRLDEPEGDPGAEHDECEWCVNLEEEEARLSLKQEVEIHHGVIPVARPGQFRSHHVEAILLQRTTYLSLRPELPMFSPKPASAR